MIKKYFSEKEKKDHDESRQEMLEDDEISPEEAAFMKGYEEDQENIKEEE